MALKGLIATPGEAAIGRLAREYRIDPDVHRRLIEEIDSAVMAERERCAKIVHSHQIAFASDACGWALDRIRDGLPADAIR